MGDPKGELTRKREAKPLPEDFETISVGDWYWVKRKDEEEEKEWLGCIVHIGSNFAEFHGVPYGSHGSRHVARIHFDNFTKKCRRESNPETVIQGNVEFFRGIVKEKLSEIKAITARLGISNHLRIERHAHSEESSRALSVLSGTDNVKEYKKALIKAKEKDLPRLFEEMKEANENLASWMSAQAIPMKAMAEGMEDFVGEIED